MSDDFEKRVRNEITGEEYVRRLERRVLEARAEQRVHERHRDEVAFRNRNRRRWFWRMLARWKR